MLKGIYNTFDAGFKDSEGNVYVMARTDDIINVGAIRLSSGAIEEVIAKWKYIFGYHSIYTYRT